jgi:hypothetical protein
VGESGREWATVGGSGNVTGRSHNVTEGHRVIKGDYRRPWATVGRPRVVSEDLGKMGGVVHGGEEGYKEDILVERSKLSVP